jgi:hypothetical protein
VLSAIGLLIAVLSGLINPFTASIIGVAVLILVWMAWITSRILAIESRQNTKEQKTIVLTSDSIPYKPYYTDLATEIVKIDNIYKKTKIPAAFLDCPKFTIIFWAEITEAFFHTHNNRYLFSYTTNVNDISGHPNRFSLGLLGRSPEWKFVIKGSDPKNETIITFNSSHILLGWKLFSIIWNKDKSKLDFSIDGGHVFHDTRVVLSDYWPQYDPKCQFHLGGWQDNWPGGISELRYYGFRVFDLCLLDGSVETILSKEAELLRDA